MEDVTLSPIGEAEDAIPALAAWFEAEWAPYYGPGGPGDALADLASWRNADRLPLAVVALGEDGAPLGVAALKADGLGSEVAPGPWLSALLVAPHARRRGIGSRLVKAIEARAAALGHSRIYTASDADAGLFAALGWRREALEVRSLRGIVPIYSTDTGPRG